MEPYVFEPDEVLIAEADVERNTTRGVKLRLTNYALIFDWQVKQGRFLNKTVEDMQYVCPLENIKLYEGVPQIKQSGSTVTIQTTSGDEAIVFEGFFKARGFAGKLKDVVTGQKIVQRGAKKVNGAINVVNDALGIDTVGTVAGVLQNGVVGTVVGSVASGAKKGKLETAKEVLETVQGASNAPQSATANATASASMSYEEQINLIKSLNELKENGILTQEEFDAKKKEILGL